MQDLAPGHPGYEQHDLHSGKAKNRHKHQLRFNECKCVHAVWLVSRLFYTLWGARHHRSDWDFDSAGVLVIQCSIIPISCKTGVVHVHSEDEGADQQVHYLAHLDPHWCT